MNCSMQRVAFFSFHLYLAIDMAIFLLMMSNDHRYVQELVL
jgi:hypothetical protein